MMSHVFAVQTNRGRRLTILLLLFDTAKRESHREQILHTEFDLVIVDEAHHLKNKSTIAWKFVNQLKKKYILLLTATPIENDMSELFNLITLLKPGQLLTEAEYKRRYVDRKDPLQPRNVNELKQLIQKVMIRNRRSTTGVIQSTRTAETLVIPPDSEEQQFYTELSRFVKAQLQGSGAKSSPASGDGQGHTRTSRLKIHPFVLKNLLRQAGSSVACTLSTLHKLFDAHSGLSELELHGVQNLITLGELLASSTKGASVNAKKTRNGQKTSSAKMEALLKLLMATPDQTVVFTGFVETQQAITEFLRATGLEVVNFHGGMSRMQKEQAISDFRAGANGAVQSFALQTLEMMGAAVEVTEWGVYDVLMPDGQVKRMTFDPETAEEQSACELVTFGTPFLESLLEMAKSRGKLQIRRLMARSNVSQKMDKKLADLVHFIKCKPPKITRTWSEENLLLLCHFHVTFHGDEVVEDVIQILIELASLADVTHLLPALESHWFIAGHTPTDALDTHDSETVHSGEGDLGVADLGATIAVHALQPQIQKRVDSIRQQNRSQLQDELGRSQHYYQTTLAKLEKQLLGTIDAERKDRIGQKMDATKRDRDHRMEDITRAYDISADVHLDQAILYRVPVVCIETQIQRRTDLFSYVFRHYPWAPAWNPITCPVCHQPTSQLERGSESWHCGCQ
ncbi:DEAD/DEAH box helicase [Alicyclobacillaceae bacterium I2511]|nr:DEAD/DEAH box helicase [Alicyclobacillaceae bacterium I2511]